MKRRDFISVAVAAMAFMAILTLYTIDGGIAQATGLGTRDHPIYWLLPTSTAGAAVEAVGKAIAKDLFEITGLHVVLRVQADYDSLIETLAASEGDAFGVLTADQYIRIYARTGGNVTPRLASVRYGYAWYYSSIYARRDSGIKTLKDLNGKVWIYNDPGSTSGYVLPHDVFEANGITVGGVVETGGHTSSMVGLIEGQGDFCTGYGSPPAPPAGWTGPKWNWGNNPERWIWDAAKNDLYDEDSRGTCTDLRRAVRYTYNLDTVLREIGVVANIGPMPNDCLCCGPDFPKEIADKIVEAVKTHIATEEGQALWSDPNFYEWTEVAPIDDSWYDGYRALLGLAIPSGRSAAGYYFESELTKAAKETIEIVEAMLEAADIGNFKAIVGTVNELSRKLTAFAERRDLPKTIPELEQTLENIDLLEEQLESFKPPTDLLEDVSDLESKLKEIKGLEEQLTPETLIEVEEALEEIGEFKELLTTIGELVKQKETVGKLRRDVLEAIDELEEGPEQIDMVEEELPVPEDRDCCCDCLYPTSECHQYYVSPLGMVANPDSGLAVTYALEGYVELSAEEEGTYECYLPISLPAVPRRLHRVRRAAMSARRRDVVQLGGADRGGLDQYRVDQKEADLSGADQSRADLPDFRSLLRPPKTHRARQAYSQNTHRTSNPHPVQALVPDDGGRRPLLRNALHRSYDLSHANRSGGIAS